MRQEGSRGLTGPMESEAMLRAGSHNSISLFLPFRAITLIIMRTKIFRQKIQTAS